MSELSKQVANYKSLKKTLSDLEEKLKEIEEEIKLSMGEQEEIIVDGYKVRWKTIIQNRFDTTEFRNKHAMLYEQFLKQSEIRRFTIT